MIVVFNRDFMGNVTAFPRSNRIQEKYAEHCQQFHPNHDGSVFWQEANEDEFCGILPPRKIKELMEGYNVSVRMAAYDYGMMVGYDSEHVEV